MLQAALTVDRFKASGMVFRSLQIIKNIQKTLKGEDYSRNHIKDALTINFMSAGEVFLDYVDMRQQARIAKAKQSEEKAAAALAEGSESAGEKTAEDGK